jgi:hypothetical protein
MNDSEFEKAVAEFVGAFEVVFRHDWSYTKGMIGDERDGATFVEPGLEDELDDWWARGVLLEKYRRLLAVMEKMKIRPQYSDRLQRVMTVFKDRNR